MPTMQEQVMNNYFQIKYDVKQLIKREVTTLVKEIKAREAVEDEKFFLKNVDCFKPISLHFYYKINL